MKELRVIFTKGLISKEDHAATLLLRAYQAAVDATTSPQREALEDTGVRGSSSSSVELGSFRRIRLGHE